MTPGVLALLFVLLVIYFIPTLVAQKRQHRQFGPIVLLNLFLGWTFIGWVGALIWASTSDVRRTA